MAPIVAVVDPYSSGRELVRELGLQGCAIVAVRHSLKLDYSFQKSWNPAPFTKVLDMQEDGEVRDGDAEEIARKLASMGVSRVLAGSEPGVEVADLLAELMRLPGNGTATAKFRRNKRAMQEAVASAGLRSITQREVTTAAQAVAFAETVGYPVIAKPVASSGTDGVYKCHTAEELTIAVNTVCDGVNTLGEANETCLVQEFIVGTEYVVDCVSRDGEHLLTMMWYYTKIAHAGGIAYDRTNQVQISADESHFTNKLMRYVHKVLDAVGIRNSPSHTEVMWVGDEETGHACLIETGARLHGAQGPRVWAATLGRTYGQAFLAVDALVFGGETWKERYALQQSGRVPFQFSEIESCQIDLLCNVAGELAMGITEACPWLPQLETMFELQDAQARKGSHVVPTRDLLTSPGYILLIGNSAQIKADHARIRQGELSGEMYRIVPARPSAKSCDRSSLRAGEAALASTDATSGSSDDEAARSDFAFAPGAVSTATVAVAGK